MSEYSGSGFNVDGMAPVGSSQPEMVMPLQALTKPMATTVAPTMKYYWNTAGNTSMYRADGFRMIFNQGFYETNLLASQAYLDNEIAEGHMHLRYASELEIDAYRMRVNPRQTIRDQVKQELEADLRVELEAKIRSELASGGSSIERQEPQDTNKDEEKVQGTDSTQAALDRLASGLRGRGATIIPQQPETLRQASIVGTDKVAGTSAGSTSTTE